MATTRVDVAALRSAVADLDDVQAEVTGIADRLQAKLAAEGESWGSDEPGATHAGGYSPESEKATDAVEDRIIAMQSYIEGITGGLHSFIDTDETNAEGFTV